MHNESGVFLSVPTYISSHSFAAALALPSAHARCPASAVTPHSIRKCCRKHRNADLKQWSVMNCCVFTVHAKFSAPIQTYDLTMENKDFNIFFYCISSAYKHQINISLDFIELERRF